MSVVDIFPDTEALAGALLRAAPVAGGRVYSSVPKSPTYPLVTVRRIGGIPAEKHRLDVARLQIDVWGTSKSEARDIAAEARQLLHEMEGVTFTVSGGWPADGTITGVEDDLGLAFIQDPETARDRYVFGVALYAHI